MEVAGGCEEFSDSAKLAVRIDLFQVGLRQAVPILSVGRLGAGDDLSIRALHSLFVDYRPPVSALLGGELKPVGPEVRRAIVAQSRCDQHPSVVEISCGQIPDTRYAASRLQRLLQAPAVHGKVPEEADRIQKV